MTNEEFKPLAVNHIMWRTLRSFKGIKRDMRKPLDDFMTVNQMCPFNSMNSCFNTAKTAKQDYEIEGISGRQ